MFGNLCSQHEWRSTFARSSLWRTRKFTVCRIYKHVSGIMYLFQMPASRVLNTRYQDVIRFNILLNYRACVVKYLTKLLQVSLIQRRTNGSWYTKRYMPLRKCFEQSLFLYENTKSDISYTQNEKSSSRWSTLADILNRTLFHTSIWSCFGTSLIILYFTQ